jgi:4-amino-4-deoxy-L-arabinose transferase-like glycosyltransferase
MHSLSLRSAWVFIFLLAATLWSIHINRPVDLPVWHEFDYSSIARNFLHEGNNIFYPRIDWRGDGPGFTEMEFPIVPWIMAQLYQIFGVHEVVGRLLSLVFMLLSLLVFSRLALKVLPECGALVAALFFVVSHEVTEVATTIQPEALLLLFYLMAVYFFVSWYEKPDFSLYSLAVISFSCAMLVKSPAAHLAIFFLLWALYKDGRKAFRRPALWLFAPLPFVPVLWWYAHASGLWHQFHNSMGVSNEDHWIGLDILKRPKVIANLLSIDILLVCGGGGLLVVLAALARNKLKSLVNRLAVSWCVAIAIYFIVIMRTAAGYWAAYYHVVAVPPIALLFAAGLQAYRGLPWRKILVWSSFTGLLLVGGFAIAGRRDITHLPGVYQDLLSAHSSVIALLILAALSGLVTAFCFKSGANFNPKPSGALIIIGCFTYFFISGQLLLGAWKAFTTPSQQFVCAACFQGKLAPNALIVTSGGICFDPGGHRVANDAPNMFYWLDRKGFTTCEGHESLAELNSLAARGARYYIADKASVTQQPGFEAELRKAFPVVAECDTAWLFDLKKRMLD